MQTPNETDATHWGIVGIAVAAGVLAAIHVGKVPPVITALRQELGLSLVAGGWVASLFNACGALLGIVAGVVADRLGARRVLTVCVVLLGAGSLMGGLAPTAAFLFASRFIEGIGFIGLIVAVPALIVAVSRPADRRLALGIWGIYMPLGMALAMALTPLLLKFTNWRGVWLVNVAVIFLYLAVMLGSMRWHRWPDGPKRNGRASDVELRPVLSSRGIWFLTACFAIYALQFFAVMTWLPTVLTELLRWTPASSALTAAFVVFANVLGNLIAAWLMRYGVKEWKLIAIAFGVMAVAALGIFGAGVSGTWRVVLAIAFSLIGGLLPAAVMAGIPAMVKSPGQLATANGVVVQGVNCGSLAGPPVMATVVGLFGGWQQAYWLIIMGCVVGAVFAFGLRLPER